jgi:hypothetical protein
MGWIVGILFLLLVAFLIGASGVRLWRTWTNHQRIDFMAIFGLLVGLTILTCLCLALIGPVIGDFGD